MLKKARMQRRIENRNSGINYLLLPITHELSELICNSILDESFTAGAGTRCMSLLSSSPNLLCVSSVKCQVMSSRFHG